MVLDRETSADAVNGNNQQMQKKKGLFGRFSKSASSKEDTSLQNQEDVSLQNQEDVVATRSHGQEITVTEADEEIVPFDLQDVASSNEAQKSKFVIGGAVCCPQPSSQSTEEETNEKTLEDAPTEATKTGAMNSIENSSSTGPSLMFCCAKNQTVDEEQYVKSNLQLPEGIDDGKGDDQYHDIMNKGSLMDADESVVTSNVDYRDEVPLKSKEDDEHFWGSRRFRWTVVLCFLLHAILISLIIVVALNSQKNQAAAASLDPISSGGNGNEEVSTANLSNVTDNDNAAEVVEDCVDKVELSASCYGTASNVLAYFRVCTPQFGDWMGVFEATENSTNLLDDDSYSWMYTCGDRSCEGEVATNVIHFNAATLLPAGTTESPILRVHLMRNSTGPTYSAVASSAEFKVVADSASC
ncbi:hypothetical protein IV203_008880 [Nitzschia inconspicua]|uniref:Uncharacterized protein n=1 Tax=Nitzschia inconspicua TaxID=303405 RepID=A0A9K3KZT5_9STRA|nr:hypothetical protein IV203_008880 [Nitzschia inconspicua]